MTDRHDFDTRWNYDDPAATEQMFRTLLANPTDPSDMYRLELLTQLARTCGLQQRFSEAHTILDEVAATLDAAAPVVAVRYHLERGRTHTAQGDPDTAREHFLGARQRAAAARLPGYEVDALHMLAIIAPDDETDDWHDLALALATSSPDPAAQRWRGSLHNNIGWTLHERGDFAAALDHFEQALHHRLHPTPGWPATAADIRAARWCVARCLRSLGRHDEARTIQRQLQAECAAENTPDPCIDEELSILDPDR